jgi:outer membrane protein assembly factor BamA
MRFPIVSLLVVAPTILHGQDTVVVRDIVLVGNKVTRDYVILREIPFNVGDTLSTQNLDNLLGETHDLILNTTLFKEVKVDTEMLSPVLVDIVITLEERWYIFPIPVFELADRNFNVWWDDFNHDLRRTVYGMNFYHQNLTGRGDQLKLVAQFGFNQLFGVRYRLPFITQKSHLGVTLGVDLERTRDVNYMDSANKQVFFRGEEFARQIVRPFITLSLRKNLYVWHLFHGSYTDNVVSDTILALNPEYFVSGSRQHYATIAYELIADWRDFKGYPKDGVRLQFLVRKNGLLGLSDYNEAEVRTLTEFHMNPVPRLILSFNTFGKAALVKEQPYHNYRGLGFGNLLTRGYEYYVVNGQSFLLAQTSAKFRFLSFILKKPIISIKYLNNIPFDFYLKPHFDIGYVWDRFFSEENPLTNTVLVGYGIGLDIVTYYDLVTSINFTINGLGESGIYLHFNL